MKIRTRAFLALWLITILVAGTIVFIAVALNIASVMDAERQRLSEILNVHGSLWRTLVELKAGQVVEDATVALAAIVAAQLTTLAMPIPAAPVDDVAPELMNGVEAAEPKRAAR